MGVVEQGDDAGYLEDERWDALQRAVPIVCVDVLLFAWVQAAGGEPHRSLLLIERDVPEGPGTWKPGLCLVGGRVRYGEFLGTAIERHLNETLTGADWSTLALETRRPTAIAEYFPEDRDGASFDPRRHAVALSYLVEVPNERPLGARGEAHRALWISEHEVARSDVGFRQWIVIEKMLGHELRS